MKKAVCIVLSLLMLLPLVACGQKDDGDIVIGGLAPLTGDVSKYGIGVYNGARIAVDEINEAGGVLGRQIKYVCHDEKGDATEAINAYNTLVQTDKIIALMGDVTTAPTIAVAKKAAEDEIPMITPTATGAEVTEIGDNIFRICFTDPFQGELLAHYASTVIGAQSAAILFDTGDPYSSGIADAFEEKAAELGLTVTAKEGYPSKNPDFSSQLTKIKNGNPDVILASGYYTDAALILTQARDLGIDVPFIGPDGWDGVLDQLGGNVDVVNGCFYCSQYSSSNPGDNLRAFMDEYRARYDEDENMFAVLGYEAIYALAKAIEAAGTTESADIVKALANLELDGLTGAISFRGGRDPARDAFIVTFVDGSEQVLGTHGVS
ncbi:MAG: ABC transporter substrate-binding protein [Oscillospiraceae bacterium]